MTAKQSCLIVGAGMAGLTAATALTTAGWAVSVLDKGRGVGGRTATRRFKGARFDHGAQYFTVRDSRFQAMVDQWLASGAVTEWSHGFPTAEGDTPSGRHPRYRGADGMTRMAKTLAEPLNVQTATRVTHLAATASRWQVLAEHLPTGATQAHHADALLLTPPAEQSLTLLEGVPITDELRSALRAIDYDPCIAVLARLDAPSAVPAPGGVFMPGEPIAWLADNQQKGISDEPALTIHAGPAFSRQHFDDDPDDVAQQLLTAATTWIGEASVIGYQVQRWRYSQPSQMHPDKTLASAAPAPIAFAGDAFDGARVEGAVLSGLAAADALIRLV